jgi:hypothetical protein
VILAVADGAGSAERSDQGARSAVEQLVAEVEVALADGSPANEAAWDALLTDAYRGARRTVVELAEKEEVSLRAYATTLTCAVASEEWLVTGQVGDGVVVARGDDGELFAATKPQRGEYANETFFLTMADGLQHLEVCVNHQRVDALAVMTDGLIRLAMKVSENEPHPPFFLPLLAFAARIEDQGDARVQLATLLESERVCKRTDDDKTLVLAVRCSNATREVQPEDRARAVVEQAKAEEEESG